MIEDVVAEAGQEKEEEEEQQQAVAVVVPWYILPVIAFSQFAGTSLWFAPNAVVPEIESFGTKQVTALTSGVQVGFIVGTLVMTYFAIPDRFTATYVFSFLGVLGAGLNLICIFTESFALWMILRSIIGICLAGIYPVGMKIASQWWEGHLGVRLGVLVGALTLGTGFPWLLRGIGAGMTVASTLGVVSGLAAFGAVLMPLLATKPGTVKTKQFRKNAPAHSTGLRNIKEIWSSRKFRAAAIGYFGHMWELYSFWAWLPVVSKYHEDVWADRQDPVLSVELTTFLAIAFGAFGSALIGFASVYLGSWGPVPVPGSAAAALSMLFASMICCFIAPFVRYMPPPLFFAYLMVWGLTVVADSGQFSTLCAKFAPQHLIGSAIAFSTCIGFSITIVSLQVLTAIGTETNADPGLTMLVLSPGPVIGVYFTFSEWPWLPCCSSCSKGPKTQATPPAQVVVA